MKTAIVVHGYTGPVAANRGRTDDGNVTRREQYTRRQERYLRRRNKMYKRGWNGVRVPAVDYPHSLNWHHTDRATPLWNGPLQTPLRIAGQRGHGPIGPNSVGVFTDYVVSPASLAHPPHVTFTGSFRLIFPLTGTKRQRLAAIGYHRRRVHAVGHKPDRMNGIERATWGAGYFCVSTGYFPEWDPLHRRPNEQDVLNGAPLYDGPFPQTPRG